MYATLRKIKNNKMRNKDKLDFINQIVKETEKQLTIHSVVLQSEQLKCLCCDGTGIVEGESYDDKQSCLTCSGRGHFN